jgi:hypothetical protein
LALVVICLPVTLVSRSLSYPSSSLANTFVTFLRGRLVLYMVLFVTVYPWFFCDVFWAVDTHFCLVDSDSI